MTKEEKERIAFETYKESLKNNNSSLLIAMGKKQAVVMATGSPIGLSKLLLEAMKEDDHLTAIIMASVEVFKKEYEKEDNHTALDCDSCEKKGDCPVEEEVAKTKDLLSMLSVFGRKEYKA